MIFAPLYFEQNIHANKKYRENCVSNKTSMPTATIVITIYPIIIDTMWNHCYYRINNSDNCIMTAFRVGPSLVVYSMMSIWKSYTVYRCHNVSWISCQFLHFWKMHKVLMSGMETTSLARGFHHIHRESRKSPFQTFGRGNHNSIIPFSRVKGVALKTTPNGI